jgi:2-(1,2-epoxy-1,2-dihydrophenyl)acetyl-CoA isomerase
MSGSPRRGGRCEAAGVSDYEQILVDQSDAVLTITLNRPEKLNAYTPVMMGELIRAVTAANDDRSIGAIVVTGAGRGFCAGADIEAVFGKGLADDHREEQAPPRETRGTDWVQLVRDSKPMIAAINGPAIGVGLTLVLPFDQILAARGAKLSARFVKMGLVPELASSHFLTVRCGFGAASWLALSGTTVLAEEAKELGLVDRVSEPDALLADAMAMATELAGNPPTQLRQIKALLSANAGETDLAAVQRRELEALNTAYRTPEHAEAVAAFMERRPPVFR